MTDVNEWLDHIVDKRMQRICKAYESNFRTYVEYEFNLINTELTMRTKLHGQDFKTMPRQLIEHMQTYLSGSNGEYSLFVSVGQEGTKGVDDSLIKMFKEYVIQNAKKRASMNLHSR